MSSTSTNRSKIRRFGPNAPTYQGQLGGPVDNSAVSQENASTSTTKLEDHSSILPHSIQTSLLQVGMRVRKSVFDGYRTNAKCITPAMDYSLEPASAPRPRRRGMFNVYEDDNDVSMTGIDSLPSSQESMLSTTSSMPPQPSSPRIKRTLNDIDSDDEASDGVSLVKVKPGSKQTLLNFPQLLQGGENRRIARPKSRKFKAAASYGTGSPMDEDFGEADFLVQL